MGATVWSKWSQSVVVLKLCTKMAESLPPKPTTSGASSVSNEAPSATPVVAKTLKRKRRRTRSHNSSPSPGRGFFVPGYESNPGSTHKMMSLSELMDAARGVTNMFLAHEIAVDKDFGTFLPLNCLKNLHSMAMPYHCCLKSVKL